MFLYSKFKYKKWAKYKPGKRQDVLQKLEYKMARKQHRNPLVVDIRFDPEWFCFGMFEARGEKQKLVLNIKLITDPSLRFHAMETVIHEGRHAYQFNLVKNKTMHWWNFRTKKWQKNWAGYFSSKDDEIMYSMQYIERDAQNYTIGRLERLGFKYRKETDFLNTYHAVLNRYEKAEEDAKKKYGLFYKYKIGKNIKEKSQE